MDNALKVLFIAAACILQLSSSIPVDDAELDVLKEGLSETESPLTTTELPEELFRSTEPSQSSTDLPLNATKLRLFKQIESNKPRVVHEDEYNFIKLVEKHGYSAEEHKVVSDDGYILSLHRITGSPKSPKASGKKVVYVQHGLFMSTINFVALGPNIDFVFLLSDAGYDVWLGNTRGNAYSRSHVEIPPDNVEFWDFSFHEIALKDVKAFIDHTLNITKQEKCAFIGYSLGTTESLILLSLIPEYNKKVSIVIEIAPVALWKYNDNALIKSLFNAVSYVQSLNWWFKIYELFPRTSLENDPCDESNFIQSKICKLTKLLAPTTNSNWFNQSTLTTYFKNWPAGSSAKTLFHLAQNALSGMFRAYDYGTKTNLEKYKQSEPPRYSMEKVTAPIAIFFGSTDVFCNEKDVEELKEKLPNVVEYKRITHEDTKSSESYFSHLDFIFDRDVKKLVYDDLLKTIKKYVDV